MDLKALRDPDRYDAWLRRILVRACYGAARRRSRGVVEITLAPDWEPPAIGADDDSPSAIALRDQLERAFGRLSPEQRATVVLHFYLGLTLDEAAETLGIPTGTMRVAAQPGAPGDARGRRGRRPQPLARRGARPMTTSTDPFDRTLSAWLESLEAEEPTGVTASGRRSCPDHAATRDVAGQGRSRVGLAPRPGHLRRRGPRDRPGRGARGRGRVRHPRRRLAAGATRRRPVALLRSSPARARACSHRRSPSGAWATVDAPGLLPSGLAAVDLFAGRDLVVGDKVQLFGLRSWDLVPDRPPLQARRSARPSPACWTAASCSSVVRP